MEKTYNYVRIYTDLKERVRSGRYAPGDRMPTESELQEEYGVSRITVKKAMNMLCEEGLVERFPGRGTFALESKEEAPPAKPVVRGAVREIGLMMSGFSSCFGQRFLRGVAEEANRQGCTLSVGLYYDSVEKERELIRRQIANGVQGIITMPVHSINAINASIVECAMENFPLVLADRYMDGMALPYVGSDNVDGAFQAVQYLFSLGHKNIGLISPIPSTTSIIERESGYMKAYAMTPYQVHPAYLMPALKSPLPGVGSHENHRADIEALKAYYKSNPEVTALMCIDYPTMNLCRTAAKELGMRIPEDISMVCFDASDEARDSQQVTYVCQPEEEIGRQAVRTLLEVIQGNREPKHILLPTQLVLGRSTDVPKR